MRQYMLCIPAEALHDPQTANSSQGSSHTKATFHRETARQLGANEDEAVFKEKLKVIARQKPKDGSKPQRNKK